MPDLRNTTLTIQNYKSFGAEGGGFPSIKLLNIIIGRNNSGKTALLDLISIVCSTDPISQRNFHRGAPSQITVTAPLATNALEAAFPRNTSGGHIPGNHWESVGSKLIGTPITYLVSGKGVSFVPDETHPLLGRPELRNGLQSAVERNGNPLSRLRFYRVDAERDIRREALGAPSISSNGAGITSTFAYFLNQADQPSELIERDVLEALNAIFAPDAKFRDIIVQLVGDQVWEIFLIDEHGTRIPLSNSGSGLKTVLHAISYFLILPRIESVSLEECIFAFEELENNLHPALQRRLFSYIEKQALSNRCHVFITTHSSCVIDMFANKDDAQIVHVSAKSGVAKSNVINTYLESRNILDDLEVRASDILQANGLIWVEGPSDRVYLNRWIELYTDGRLVEGVNYQCMFYGGKLLSHYSAEIPEEVADELIATLRVNRNAMIIMDSDKRSHDARTSRGRINATKLRLKEEFEKLGALAWITFGKEIENYLPHEALMSVIDKPIEDLGKFEDIADYLERHRGVGWADKFKRGKVSFAHEISPHISRESLMADSDLANHVSSVVQAIDRWNGN